MTGFAALVTAWQRKHGRHDLPWQRNRDPYRIWVSEIMLQQTQVSTVIPYYERFMARFPDIAALAEAKIDDVLAQWSGLGYYSRARHLHRAAQIVSERHDGCFPGNFEDVASLPGIGRSTAAAICVFAFGLMHAILDGNVKRVLARAYGIQGYPGDNAVSRELWRLADELLPDRDVEAYTQGLMDLGATVCTRVRPDCGACPVASRCVALRDGRIAELPTPRPRRPLPHRSTVMLVVRHQDKLLLEKRPAAGIWGGLWCFPETDRTDDAVALCLRRFGAEARIVAPLPDIEHGFTHYTLTISPRLLQASRVAPHAAQGEYEWLDCNSARSVGIPAPVRRIIDVLTDAEAVHGT
jgi:A/G-specific adenine glycosylase